MNNPPFNRTKVLPSRNMTFVANPSPIGFLYAVASIMMNIIVPKQKPDFVDQVIPEAFDISQYKVRLKLGGVLPLLALVSGPLTFCLFFLVLAAMLHFAWMTSRRRRERERRPFDRKCDPQLKCCLTALLIALMALYFLGLASAYYTSVQMEDGARLLLLCICNITRTTSELLNFRTKFLFRRHNQEGFWPVDLRGPYEEITQIRFWNFVYNESHHRTRRYNKEVDPSSLSPLSGIVEQLAAVHRDLVDVKRESAVLWLLAEQLNEGLHRVKHNLLRALLECDDPACVELQRRHHIAELNTHFPFTPMPDLSELLNSVSSLLDDHIKEEVAEGLRSVADKVAMLEEKSVHYFHNISEAGRAMSYMQMRTHRAFYFWAYDRFEDLEQVERVREHIEDYYFSQIRHVVFTILVILALPLTLFLGLVLGFCGTRAKVDGSFSICGRDNGARCVYCAMVLSILVFSVCAVLFATVFAFGALLHRAVCDPFGNPLKSSMFRLIDEFVYLDKIIYKDGAVSVHEGVKVSRVLHDIMYFTKKTHKYYYETFQVRRLFGMDKYKIYLNNSATVIKKYMKILKELPPIKLDVPANHLKDSTRRKLRILAQIPFSNLADERIPAALKTNSERHTSALQTVSQLAEALERAARGAGGRAPAGLRAAAAGLRDLRQRTILPMLQLSQKLNTTTRKLYEARHFNITNVTLSEAIEQMMTELDETEWYLREGAGEQIKATLLREAKDITEETLHFYDNIVATLATPAGHFMPPVVRSARLALCEHVLWPVHGVWLSLLWSMLVLLGMLAVCRRLARIFLQTDPYPGPEVVRAYDAVKRFERRARKERRRGGARGLCAGACNDVRLPAPPPDAHCCHKY
ncbi:uncharacterized protein LOC106142332 [Amyelois transitella]|uniref:uncharacterized protein LOC106142332 n=1 Tax=Amyelois transitella TaxID=680683 RepID=UPI00298FC775|nr:uncharacterized protein LOC106142332 [Amyelois transitella]